MRCFSSRTFDTEIHTGCNEEVHTEYIEHTYQLALRPRERGFQISLAVIQPINLLWKQFQLVPFR